MAFSKELEEVIEAALADGVITEKERAVIHKKALIEGVDPDEVDVVIDGRLQQIQKSIDDAKQKVRKCPSCGEIIPAMTAVCPSCGQVIDTTNADNKALAVYMDKLETSLVKLKENGASKYNNKVKAELEGMIRQGKAMYGDNKKIAYLISEVEASITKFDKAHKQQSFIKILIGFIIIAAIIGWNIKSNADEASAIAMVDSQFDQAIEVATQQCDSLSLLLDKIPLPNKNNYKECETALFSIQWKEVPCPMGAWNHWWNEYSHLAEETKSHDGQRHAYFDLKETIRNRKRNIADQIFNVYKEIYSSKAEEHAPDKISHSSHLSE